MQQMKLTKKMTWTTRKMMTAELRGAGHRLLLLLAGLAAFLGAAHAHRQPEVFGTVVHGTENGAPVTKVTWRLHAHDAIHALGSVPEVSSPDLDDEAVLIELAAYVASWVDYSEGEVTTLGAEVEGNYAYVYQLVTGHVTVRKAGVLSDVAVGWSNFVNFEKHDGAHHSIVFTADYPEGTGAALRHEPHTH